MVKPPPPRPGMGWRRRGGIMPAFAACSLRPSSRGRLPNANGRHLRLRKPVGIRTLIPGKRRQALSVTAQGGSCRTQAHPSHYRSGARLRSPPAVLPRSARRFAGFIPLTSLSGPLPDGRRPKPVRLTRAAPLAGGARMTSPAAPDASRIGGPHRDSPAPPSSREARDAAAPPSPAKGAPPWRRREGDPMRRAEPRGERRGGPALAREGSPSGKAA